MPRYVWPDSVLDEIQSLERRTSDHEASALLMWALDAVSTLHYIADLDAEYQSAGTLSGTHPHVVVDVAHARWASSSCVTAIDLCAAAVARLRGHKNGKNEFSLFNYFNKGHGKTLREDLSSDVAGWMQAVNADSDYRLVKTVRNQLTHARSRRHFSLSNGGPERLGLYVCQAAYPVGGIVARAKGVATKHIESFVPLLPSL